jgi:hypothetical protein
MSSRRIADRPDTVDVTDEFERYGVRLPPLSPLQAEARALSMPKLNSSILSRVISEEERRLAVLRDERWRALFLLGKLERHNTWIPTLASILSTAELMSATGHLDEAALEVMMTKAYGPECAWLFAGRPAQRQRAGNGGATTATGVASPAKHAPSALSPLGKTSTRQLRVSGAASTAASGSADLASEWRREPRSVVAFEELMRHWRKVFLGFASRDAIGTPRLDLRQLRAAMAIVDSFKARKDVRFAINAAIKAVGDFNGDDALSRLEIEMVFALLTDTAQDAAHVLAVLDTALITTLTNPFRAGYPISRANRTRVDTLRTKVLPHPSLEPLFGPHPSSTRFVPLSMLEMLAPATLRDFIVKRKTNGAKALRAREYLLQKTKRKVLAAFHDNMRVRKQFRRALKRLNKLALSLDFGRLVECWKRWKRFAVVMRATLILQSFARQIVALREMRRQSARIYVAEQVFKLWKSHRLLLATRWRRQVRMRAAMRIQALFRGRKTRRWVAGELRAQMKRDREARIARLARTLEQKRLEGAQVLQRNWRRHKEYKSIKAGLRFLASEARKRKIVMMGRAAIEAEVAATRAERQKLDAMAAVRLKAAAKTKTGVPVSSSVLAKQASKRALIRAMSSSELSDSGTPTELLAIRNDAARVLQRFAWTVVSRSRMRRLLVGRVERFFSHDVSRYFYGWFLATAPRSRDVPSAPAPYEAISFTWKRPSLLGPSHELAVQDRWIARWDPRIPDSLWFYNQKYHVAAFTQPPGTVLCPHCQRTFAQCYCIACSAPYCHECHAAVEAHQEAKAPDPFARPRLLDFYTDGKRATQWKEKLLAEEAAQRSHEWFTLNGGSVSAAATAVQVVQAVTMATQKEHQKLYTGPFKVVPLTFQGQWVQ